MSEHYKFPSNFVSEQFVQYIDSKEIQSITESLAYTLNQKYQGEELVIIGVLKGSMIFCKGRGFAGVMKRHNFHGQRASHGVKKVHRHAGGTGMSASPSRLFKGKRMAGQYGNAQTTVRNLKVVGVDSENDLLLVRGAIPGPNGGFVVIRETNKVG